MPAPTTIAETRPTIDQARRSRLAAVRGAFADSRIDSLLVSRDCDIRYFTGFCGHDSFLLITPSHAFCISDNRYDAQLNPLRAGGYVDVVIGTRHRLALSVADLCREHRIGRLGIQPTHLTIAGQSSLAAVLEGPRIVEAPNLVEDARMCKDAFEIDAIESAIRINEAGLKETLLHIKPGMKERAIGARLEFELKTRGADAFGFNPIIAVGENGALPHFETGDTTLVRGSSLLIDWGCTCNGYNSDLTRTFGVGKMPEKIEEIYSIVLEAQMRAIEAIQPGKVCAEIDGIARRHIADAGYGEFFGHGLGHGLGLMVHEAPYFNNLQTDIELKPGMVMTVEPGIYLPGIGGVRIEDDIVVTQSGCRVLSTFPKKLSTATIAV